MTGQIINQKRLSGASKYDYCFHCLEIEEKKASNLPKQPVPPLFYITTLEMVDAIDQNGKTFQKKVFDNFYRCSRCGKELTVNDFVDRYTKPYDVKRGY